jgi:coatomer subunit beta
VATDLKRATGFNSGGAADERKLNRVLQLTGFSDPVYAEAYVTVHQYDIVMDVTAGPAHGVPLSVLTST